MSSSVAILVDGDNISSALAGQILRKTSDLGTQRMRLAYCNTHSITGWESAPSFRAIHAGSRKNGADFQLSIDAMKFALKDGVQTFVIASSDGDLVHIAHALRELGRHVVGLGNENAKKSLGRACSTFIVIAPPEAKVATSKLGKIDTALRAILEKQDPQRQGILVSKINGLVRKEVQAIKISEEPEKTWPKYLAKRTDLYTMDGDGKDKRVRIASATDED